MRVLSVLLTGLTAAVVSMPSVYAQTPRAPQTERPETPRVQMPRPGRVSMIGVRLSDVQADQVKTYKLSKAEGAIVESVNPNSPAVAAGIREKDVIVEFDGERVRSVGHLTRLVAETPAGREVGLVVMRDGRRINLQIKPEAGNSTWFDPRFSGMIDADEIRRYAEQAGRSAREMGRNIPEMVGRMREGTATRGRLGVSIQEVTPDLAEYFGVKSGVMVASVMADSPASKAGLKAGDVITAVNGKGVGSPSEVVQALPSGAGPYDVKLTVVRDKKEMSLTATLN